MRVLQVIDSLAPGGAERSLVAIAPWLRSRGVEVTVVALGGGGLEVDLLGGGTPVRHVQGSSRWQRFRNLAEVTQALGPDLVHTTLFESDVLGRVAARRTGVPVVSSLVNTSYGPEHGRQPGIRAARLRSAQALDILTARVVERFHAVSHVVADVMATRLRVRRDTIDVVWRGRDRANLGVRTPARRERARARFGVGDGMPLVAMLARHEFDKGIDVAIDAIARLRERHVDATLVIAGRTGNETGALQSSVREHGLEGVVRLLGPRDDAAEILCAADVFVAPSRREGMPGAVLEAMALEVPVVVSDIPSMREAVGGGLAALFVAVGDPDQLAKAVDRTLSEPAAAVARAVAARRRFDDCFTIERAADGMLAFYERSLAGVARA